MAQEPAQQPEDRGLVTHAGPVEVDWPRTIGYYGGLALAVGLELIPTPLAVFVAAIPLFKMLNRPRAPRPIRFAAQLLDGAAKPVGGDGESTFRFTTPGVPNVRED